MSVTLQECFETLVAPNLTALPSQVPVPTKTATERERLWQSLIGKPAWVRHEAMTIYDDLHNTNA